MTKSANSTLVIGLSGPSSSGKTTLARLLRGVFNIDTSPEANNITVKLFILHEDDFYKSDKDIPLRTVTSTEHGTRTLQDWDCVESLDLPRLDTTIRHIKRHGRIPDDLSSKEDKNSVGEVGVSDDEVRSFKEEVTALLKQISPDNTHTRSINICILDGFLLFPPPPDHLDTSTQSTPTSITTASNDDNTVTGPSNPHLLNTLHNTLQSTLDLKVFLPATRAQTITRRAARSGYVTMEGFWADPPGYVEDVVWPNYRRDHAWMFNGGDADLGVLELGNEALAREGIVVGPGGDGKTVDMKGILEWGVSVVLEKIRGLLGKE